ncbi:MAG: radical SAM protein [Armatimonadetes bacterium]|nr:radical SAM protein [Armatimonadota bacterium]
MEPLNTAFRTPASNAVGSLKDGELKAQETSQTFSEEVVEISPDALRQDKTGDPEGIVSGKTETADKSGAQQMSPAVLEEMPAEDAVAPGKPVVQEQVSIFSLSSLSDESLDTSGDFKIGKNNLTSEYELQSASGACSSSYNCGGGGGTCSSSYNCSGGGGTCSSSSSCSGGGGSGGGACSSSYSCGGGGGTCSSSYNCSGGGGSGGGACSSSYSCGGGGGTCSSSYNCGGGGSGGHGVCSSSYNCGGGGGTCSSSYDCGLVEQDFHGHGGNPVCYLPSFSGEGVDEDLSQLRPRLPAPCVVMKKGEKYLFLDPERPEWIVTTRNGALTLRRSDGEATIGQIIAGFGDGFGPQIMNFFLSIYGETRFLSAALAPQCGARGKEPFGKPCEMLNLTDVYLHVTEKCNLRCIYCYVDLRDKKPHAGRKIGLEDCKKLTQDINDAGYRPRYNLTGGEPLLVGWLPEYVEFLKEKGHEVVLFTNATLFKKKAMKRLAGICDLIRISADGYFAEDHDYHRGKNTFTAVKSAIESLLALKARLMISVTVTRKNRDHLGAIAKAYGSMVNYAPLFPKGDDQAIRDLLLSGDEYYDALFRTEGVEPYARVARALENARNHRIYKCATGSRSISISETGDVYPCQLIHFPEFLAGNILKRPFPEIYRDSTVLKTVRSITVDDIEGCKECNIRYICGGGCLARSFYETGSIKRCGSFCSYEKKALIEGIFKSYTFDA